MLAGVDLKELKSYQERALIMELNHLDKIEHLKTLLLTKAIFISGIKDTTDKNKAIDEYNEILRNYQDEINPGRIKKRKEAVAAAEDKLKTLKGSVRDFLGGVVKVIDQKKVKGKDAVFDKLKGKNWEKIDG